MGSLKGVEIAKGSTGPNATGPDTSTSALLFTGTALSTLVVNTVYKVTTLKQASDLGINAAYDVTNDCVVFEHINEFYRMKGEGTPLYLMLVNVTPQVALEDTGSLYAKKVLIAGGGAIKQLAFAYNLTQIATETITDGFNSDIRAAIPKAQLLAEWAYSTDRPVHIFLEGRALTATLSGAINLRDIEVSSVLLSAPKVSVVVGQDWDYAEARKVAVSASKTWKYAAVGTALGTLSSAEMNQSIAEVAVFNLSDALRGKMVTGGLSSHVNIADAEPDLQGIEDKGYIFPISFSTVSGLRWNNDHCCVPIIIDVNGNINEHMIYYSRTADAASLRLKAALLQRLKSRVTVNSTTGTLSTAVIKNLEAEGDNVFSRMAGEGFISDGKTFINKDSDLITPPKSLLVSFKLVPTAILDNVTGTINLVKSIQI